MRRALEDDFRDFVRTRSAALVRIAFLLTGDRGHAEDLVQTALLRTAKKWTRLTDRDRAFGYVRTAIVNEHISGKRRRRVAEVPMADVPDIETEQPASPRVLPALDVLSPGMRSMIVLRYFEELSIAETAAALGCSEGNVKSQTARALEKLRVAAEQTTSMEDFEHEHQ